MSQDSKSSDKTDESQVIDFSEARAQRMDEKRRKTERIFFKHLMGIYCVSESTELKQVEVMDVSEEGLSFQIPFSSKDPSETSTRRFKRPMRTLSPPLSSLSWKRPSNA